MVQKKTNEKLLNELMETAMECFQLSDPNGTVQEVLKENHDLNELRDEVLKRMVFNTSRKK